MIYGRPWTGCILNQMLDVNFKMVDDRSVVEQAHEI
jgi:hypothetical protein